MDRLEVAVDEGILEVELLGRGEPVVVIQTALTADELTPLSRDLAGGGDRCVVHVHRRGYAASSRVHGSPSIAADAADTSALIRALGIGPAHVVGASYSAAVALALASTDPGLVHTLTVVEPPPAGTPAATEFQQANLQLLRSYEAGGAPRALEEFMSVLVGPDWREVSERDLPGSVRAMERDATTFFTWDVPALLSWQLSDADTARVRCPVLYVGGGRSAAWFTEMRARLLSLLPYADAATVEEAGHLVASTHPSALADLLVQHFRRHPVTRPSG